MVNVLAVVLSIKFEVLAVLMHETDTIKHMHTTTVVKYMLIMNVR